VCVEEDDGNVIDIAEALEAGRRAAIRPVVVAA
jgi:hypothetical protein